MTTDPISTSQNQQPVFYGVLPEQRADEINIVDIFVLLKRRKKVIYYSVIVFTVLSIIFSFLKPPIFTYTLTMEVGSRLVDNEIVPIDSSSTVLAKLTEGYIPLASNEYLKNNVSDDAFVPVVTGRIPAGSEIIVLETKGSRRHESDLIQQLNSLVEKVQEGQRSTVLSMKKILDISINDLLRQIAGTEAELGLYKATLKRQDDIEKLLNEELNRINDALSIMKKIKSDTVQTSSNESNLLTVMSLNYEEGNAQKSVAEIKERLYVQLPKNRDELNEKIGDAKWNIQEFFDSKSKLLLEKNSIKATRAITVPIKLLGTTGLKTPLIILLGIFFGLLFGVFLVAVDALAESVRRAEMVDS